MLSHRQQVARMRQLAVRALGAYPLADPELRFIAHGENATFRVDATASGGRARFLLRVHRPARHGRHVDPAAAIRSELDWLTALRAGTCLSVPEPVRAIDGKLTTTVARGFGYWVYDMAVSLWELRHRGDYGQFRAALIEGYARHRPPPYGDLAHLDDFIAARDVAFGLWFAGNAQVSPVFRAGLDEVLASVGRSLDVLLGD
jgi:Ser/Thr protein kinase RdoA (MazF antagonist)